MKFVSHYQLRKYNEKMMIIIIITNLDFLPSTSDVSNVVVAALRRPAGKLTPIFSNLLRRSRPPFFDLALMYTKKKKNKPIILIIQSTPSKMMRERESLRHFLCRKKKLK